MLAIVRSSIAIKGSQSKKKRIYSLAATKTKFIKQTVQNKNQIYIFVQPRKMDINRLLIREVRKRPQLYHVTLLLSERTRDIADKLWEEISDNLHNKIYYCSES